MTSKSLSNLVNHQAIEAAAGTWLARQDNTAEWTASDEQQLHDWLDGHVAHRVAWLRLKRAWDRADALGESRWASPWRFAPPAGRGHHGRIAAFACAVIASVGLYLAHAPQLAPAEREQFATAVGARQGLTLADGSHVMLNTHTRARVAISGKERKFWLDEGEAFFDIQRDPGRPFVLLAGNDRITVLGTKFSVRRDGDLTRVTVLEGRVKFEAGAAARHTDGAESSTILTPNYSAIASAGSVLVGVKTAQETERELSWRSGWLEFDNRPLAEIAAEFNRYNRRQLVIDDAGGLLLSGRFDMYNVDGFVRSIETGFGAVVHTEGEQIHVSLK